MAKDTAKEAAKEAKEQRRLEKEQAREQAKAAKAGERAAAKAAKAERKARKGGAGPEAEEPAFEPEPIVVRPRLELVTERGPVKHLHWEAEERARLARQAEEAAHAHMLPADEPEAAAPLREEAQEPPAELPLLAGRRRTLYTTDHGNQVVAYEQGGRRQLAITEDGREVPFSEDQVDRVIGAPETTQAEPLQETVVVTAPPEEPKRRGFWRRKQAAPAAPVVEHIYRPVELVDRMPVAEAEAAPIAQPTQQVAAWEPSASLLETPRPTRPARPAAAPRKATPAPPKQAPRKRKVAKPRSIYPGDNHPVIDIEGIGPVYAKKLEAMGITTTGLLDVAKARRVAARLQVPLKTVKKWQAEAELIKVRGIGPQFAEALARSGVTGIDELKRRKPDDIARQVAKYLASVDQTVVGQPLTAKRIARWKRKAQPMRRVRVNAEKLAIPTHGIPPPWLREDVKGKKTARKTAKRPSRKTGARRAK